MNLQHLSNQDLIAKTKSLAHEERKITAQLLRHLQLIDQRKLYALRGYSSLFEFVEKELGYSSGAAYRRVSAMRLLKSLNEPEAKKTEQALESGALSLSVMTELQTFFKA